MKPDFEPLDISLNELESNGASQAEALLVRDRGLSIRVFDGRLEEFVYSDERGLGLRAFMAARPGRAYTSDVSPGSIADTACHAVANAKVSPEDPNRSLPDKSLIGEEMQKGVYLGEDLEILSSDLAATPPADKIELAFDLERKAREYDPRVTGVETAVYTESTADVLLANNRGLRAAYRYSICYGYLMAIARDGDDSQTGFGYTAGHSFSSLDSSQAAVDASSRAVDMLGAKPVESVRVPVLLDNLTVAELIASFTLAMSGEAVMRGRSFLAGRLGNKVASPGIDIIDDGLIKGGFGSTPFDGEGVATSKKYLVRDGVLSTFMHNCYTAACLGAETTGNAGRASYNARVGVSPTNIHLPAGDATPDELRSGMGSGLEVIELQGSHVGLNPVTGEVSVGAKGFWVKDGRRAHAVREVTIAGTMDDIFGGIAGVGSDMRFSPLYGSIGTPSIMFRELAVSGK